MTALDHSSIEALADDLNRHRDSEFCFYHKAGEKEPPWRLKCAQIDCAGTIIAFYWANGGFLPFRLCNGWLQLPKGYKNNQEQRRVMITQSGYSSDESLRQRLDDNLKRAFS